MTRLQLFFEENRNLENFPDSQVFGKFTRFPGFWENFPDSQAFGEFPKFPTFLFEFMNGVFSRFWKFLIWLSPDFQNFTNTWESGEFRIPEQIWGCLFFKNRKFFKCLAILKFSKFPEVLEILQISSHFRNFQVLKNIPFSTCNRTLGNFGNSSNAWESWEISQIPRNLGNSPNSW